MIEILLACDERFHAPARYVFEVLFEIIGLTPRFVEADNRGTPGVLLICYGKARSEVVADRKFVVEIAEQNYADFRNRNQEPKARFHTCENGERIPYFFHVQALEGDRKRQLISRTSERITCRIDLIASAYHLLSLENEAIIGKTDALGRFQRQFAKDSDAAYDYPVVDIYASLISGWLKCGCEALGFEFSPGPRWPNNAPFALCLTHDIDRFNTWTLSKSLRVLRRIATRKSAARQRLKKSVDLIRSLLAPQNWRGNFELLMELEKGFNANSSYYFVPRSTHELDPDYEFNSARMKRAISKVRDNGFEVGIHGSIESSANKHRLLEERQTLETHAEAKIAGGRQHYLCFRNPATFDNLAVAGLEYDSTLGFGADLGFRTGTSFPYRPIRLETQQAYPFYELPLIIMDAAIVKDKRFLVLGEEEHTDLWARLKPYLEHVRTHHGCLTILWHNTDFDPFDVTGYTRLYREILEWGRASGAWLCAAGDIINWWRRERAAI